MENKNIAFGGITRSIGGAVCADGDLHTAVDVCNDGVGLQLLEKPKTLFTLADGEDLLCIHEPEGEEKHYITQLVVPESTNNSGENNGEEETPEDEITPSVDESDSEDNESGEEETETPSALLASPWSEVPTMDAELPSADVTIYENVVATEVRNDNGGTSYAPSVETPDPTQGGHIYLCYWTKEGNSYVRKQYIDITPYGKVTSIQPMGNTLVCNHEGGEDYSKEIRYWLWSADEGKYLGLGNKPPMINITFGLKSTFEYYPKMESTFKDNSTKYKKYGGTFFTSYPYTDTVSVYYSDYGSSAYVPPFEHDKDDENSDLMDHWSPTYSLDGVESPDGKTDVSGMKIDWTRSTLGCYNKFIANQTNDNKFVFPFYVRYSVELFDGSLIMHSYPVLMIPNSRGPIFALDGKYGLFADRDDRDHTYEKVRLRFQGRTYGFASTLVRKIATLSAEEYARLENWKDLIRGISIYVTPPMYNYKQGGQVLGWQSMSKYDPSNGISNPASSTKSPWDAYYTIGQVVGSNGTTVVSQDSMKLSDCFTNSNLLPQDNTIFWPWNSGSSYAYDKVPGYIMSVPQKDEQDIQDMHDTAGQFFKLATIDYDDLLDLVNPEVTPVEAAVEIRSKRLQTIANQDVMQDDNGSHDVLSADVLYGYNHRLNLAKVNKELHAPLPLSTQFCMSKAGHNAQWQLIILAHNGGKVAEIKRTEAIDRILPPSFIFYPNTEAYEALLLNKYSVGGSVLTRAYKVRLREHKALNGAYWRGDIYNTPLSLNEFTTTSWDIADTISSNTIVDESNKIYTSETDNPFYVPFGNINIAGGGEVRALCAATQAMSQGQFGQHPMYCFTSEGVWAMTVSDTGGWATIQPVTRDVITAGTKPLGLDSTVMFLADRGLLQLAGAETTPLSGAVRSYDYSTFSKLADSTGLTGLASATGMGSLLTAAGSLQAFPDYAVLTYDARNGRVYVTPLGVGASWVLNLKSGLWTQSTTHIDTQVTTYPGCEGQQGNQIVEIGSTLGYQKDYGLVITRPVKFGDGSVLRRIHELAVRGQFKPYSAAVKTALWGTRDWINNALVASSQNNRITRWGGSPYFGHCVGLFITQPADYLLHVVGVDAVIDMEHYNKLR